MFGLYYIILYAHKINNKYFEFNHFKAKALKVIYEFHKIRIQPLSPLILLASCMSFGMMVTLLAWMAQRLVSSKRPTM